MVIDMLDKDETLTGVILILLFFFGLILSSYDNLQDDLGYCESSINDLNYDAFKTELKINDLENQLSSLKKTNNDLNKIISNKTNQINQLEPRLSSCMMSNINLYNNVPKPLKLARIVNDSRPYEEHVWDCSDMANEWVRLMRDNGYPDTNYTCGMYMKDGKAISHAWGTYTQHVEITNPRFIDGLEISRKYIYQPWKDCIDNEVS